MKTYTLLIVSLVFSIAIDAQDINREIVIQDESPFLLGKIDKSGLMKASYESWFSKNLEAYQPDENIIKSLDSELNTYSIKLFMGTWCGDSKREVPKFYKILEACNFPMEQLEVIALSRKANMYKQSPNHEEAGLNIHRVPTFIIYKNGKELNRIVEEPVETLEADLLEIISENNYNSHYQIVAKINEILNQEGLKGLERAQKNLLKDFDNQVSSMYELNTYGKVLYTSGRLEEALEVFKLNTLLFPDNPRTYQSLANTLGINGQKRKAVKTLKKALKRLPDNEDLKENLELIQSN
ncbi:MAG: hypothetical protein HRU26_17110 [Psychroserpens sp.]|nr:hypothetical protein [Psychroserpens sp.]